jgi:hypothetical protein
MKTAEAIRWTEVTITEAIKRTRRKTSNEWERRVTQSQKPDPTHCCAPFGGHDFTNMANIDAFIAEPDEAWTRRGSAVGGGLPRTLAFSGCKSAYAEKSTQYEVGKT